MRPELTLVPKAGVVYTTQRAKELLERAIDQQYESVIIFGFKDQKIHIRSSANNGTLELLGALEMAKQELAK